MHQVLRLIWQRNNGVTASALNQFCPAVWSVAQRSCANGHGSVALAQCTDSAAVSRPGFLAHSHVHSLGTREGSGQLFLPGFPKWQGNTRGCPPAPAVYWAASPFLFLPAPPLMWPSLQHAEKNQEALKLHHGWPARSAARSAVEGDPGGSRSSTAAASTRCHPGAMRPPLRVLLPVPQRFNAAFPLPRRGMPNLRTLSS